MPPGFSWVDEPRLAALGYPDSPAEIAWLRQQGIEVLISLTERAPPRSWVNEAGMMSVHVPVVDMGAPTQEQLDTIVDAIRAANAAGLGVAVHCAAGRGRTGTVVAAYFVARGATAEDAIAQTRRLRPGSIETFAQMEAVEQYARRVRRTDTATGLSPEDA